MIDYSIECPSDNLNVDILHENGIYIGNNQFISEKNINLIKKIIGELK